MLTMAVEEGLISPEQMKEYLNERRKGVARRGYKIKTTEVAQRPQVTEKGLMEEIRRESLEDPGWTQKVAKISETRRTYVVPNKPSVSDSSKPPRYPPISSLY